MKLRQRNKDGRIFLDQLRLKIVVIEASEGCQFSLFTALVIGIDLAVFFIIRQVLDVLFDIFSGSRIEIGKSVISILLQ